MLEVIKNLNVRTKLLFIGILFSIPIIILLYLYINTRQEAIDFSDKEYLGNQYLKELRILMEYIPKHHYYGLKSIENSNIRRASEEKTETTLQNLENIDKELSPKFTSPVTEGYNDLKSFWSNNKNSFSSNDESQKNNSYIEVISKLRSLIAQVGDVSNLILDPDLDSYYLMDATLLKLPGIQNVIYNMAILTDNILSKGGMTVSERSQLMAYIGELTFNVDGLNTGVNVAFENNPEENIRPVLSKPLEEIVDLTKKYNSFIQDEILNVSVINVDSRNFFNKTEELLESSFILWDKSIIELDGLLIGRMDEYSYEKYFTLIYISAILLISILLFIYVYRLIVNPLNSLNSLAQKVSAGDLNVRSNYTHKDEIGLLGNSIDQMIDKMKDLLADLEKEKRSIENKIEEAVKESNEQKNYFANNIEIMLNEIQKFSEGDLTIKLNANSNDEIGKLFGGFNSSIDNVRELIANVSEAIHATADASQKITARITEMTSGTQEQSMQTQEVSAAIEQMTRIILETSSNASEASKIAEAAGTLAKEGGLVVQDTVNGMTKIESVVKDASLMIQELGKSSDEIGNIIQVIDDIADQTNLLALNAAIEAARAGEQGRGFAVVADEVRKLAERTTKATKEIAGMIQKIQSEVGNAVISIQSGTGEVESGKNMASKAGLSMNQIVDTSTKVVSVIKKVASANEEQTSAAERISQNIASINNVAQSNSGAVDYIAQSAEELKIMTENLQKLITKFQYDTPNYNNKSISRYN